MLPHAQLTPHQPVAWVKQLFRQPPGDWPTGWQGFPNVNQAFRELLVEAREEIPAPPQWTSDRGVVLCGGGWRFFPSLFVTIACVRRVGCDWPVQVWYLGDQGEFDERMRHALAAFNVEWVCANTFAREQGLSRRVWGGWELKPFAATYAPFREILALDADSYPAVHPTKLFEHPEYHRTGAIFWPDAWNLQPAHWALFGLPHFEEPSWESGQFVVDKARHWQPLWLTTWLNNYSDYVYQYLYGDKDTFHLAWRFCGHEFSQPATAPLWHVCAFMQLDFDGQWQFCHRIRDKFRWSDGMLDGQPLENVYRTEQWCGSNQHVPDLPHEDFAHDMLRYSDELIRPERYFEFVDGPHAGCRAAWDSIFLRNELALPDRFAPEDVIVDCEAGSGALVRAALRRGATRIVAVESRPAYRAALQHNVQDFATRATVLIKDAPATPESLDALLAEARHWGNGRIAFRRAAGELRRG